jgi:hypothetical protein
MNCIWNVAGDFVYLSSLGGAKNPYPSHDVSVVGNVGRNAGRHALTAGGVDGLDVRGNDLQDFRGAPIDFEVRVKGDGPFVHAKPPCGVNGNWRKVNVFRSTRQLKRAA